MAVYSGFGSNFVLTNSIPHFLQDFASGKLAAPHSLHIFINTLWHPEHSVEVIKFIVPQSLQTDAILAPQKLHFNELSSTSFLHLGHCVNIILI